MQGLPYEDLMQSDETNLRSAYIALLRRLTGTGETAPPLQTPQYTHAPEVSPLFAEQNLDVRATDRSTLPPVTKLPTCYRMPYRSLGKRFAGRVEALWQLHDLLNQDDTAIVEGVGVVMGTGGLGKTQLATEYVHRFGNYYPGGVFWTDADQDLATVVQQIVTGAGIDINSALPVTQQCEVLWQKLVQTPTEVLIIFDNFSETEALEPWLPVGTNLKTLVTTRRRDLAYPKLSVPFLSHKEALELLNNGERKFSLEATPLIDTLGGLPLALELARNFLDRRPTVSIDAMLGEIAKLGELAVLNVFTEHYKNELPTGHEKAVGATFQLSWDLASDTEQTLLRFMAIWAPSPVPRRLLKRAIGDTSGSVLTDPVDKGISTLERLSLVELDEDFDPQIHRLLRGFIRSQPYEDDEAIKKRAVDVVKTELSRTCTETDTAALTELEKVLSHGYVILDSDISEPQDAIDIANYICGHQKKRSRYQLAKVAGCVALALAEKNYEQGHSAISVSQSYLALVLQDLGDLEVAKTLLTESLAANQQIYEPGHPYIAISQSNLAMVLKDLGDLEAAKTLLTESLAADQQSYEMSHPYIAISQSNLALMLQDLGDLEVAKTLLTESLAANQKIYEPGHPSIAISQSNLAVVLQGLGDLEVAKTLFTESLAANQKSYELGHLSIAKSQSNLAMVLKDLSELEAAKTLLTGALAAIQKTYELGHPSIATSQSNLALVLQDLGDLETAKTLLTEALAANQQSYELGHPSIAKRQSNLALVLQDLGDLEAAKTLLIEALAADQQSYEPGHPSIARSQSNLAMVLQDLGDLEVAKTLLVEAYKAFKNRLGEGHPNTLTVKDNLDFVESEIQNSD